MSESEAGIPETGRILVRIDPDIEDLIPGFIENRRADVGVLRQALASDDWETVRLRGHSMKGAGKGYGFDGVTIIGAAIEKAALAQNAADVERQLVVLDDYLDRVELVAE